MRSWADPSTSVATTLSITTSAATTATPLPLLHRGIFCLCFSPLDRSSTEGSEIVRNQSETGQNATSLSLSLAYSLTLLPELLRLLLFQFPLPLLLVLLLLLVHCEISGPFPDPHKLILLPNLKSNAFTHGSLLSLLDLLLPPALPPHPLLLHHPAPPLPLVHLGISALAFKSNCTRVKGQKRVRNQSETNQKPVRNRPNAISLSLPLPIPSPSHQNSYAYSYCNFHYHYCQCYCYC